MADDEVKIKGGLTPYEYKIQQEALAREYQIAIAEMNLLHDELADCARRENVNQFVNCKELREKYWTLCKDRYRGMIFPEGLEPSNRAVPGINWATTKPLNK
eukprot:gene6574-7079_t